jgi:hypothetical protein
MPEGFIILDNIRYFGIPKQGNNLSMFRFYPVFIFLYLYIPLNAQPGIGLADTLYKKPDYNLISGQQKNYLNSLYLRRVDISDELINGREYIPYYYGSNIKPLLFDGKKRSGSLVFKGRRYNNLFLEYDTYRDDVIYSDSLKFIEDKFFRIALNKDHVNGFSLIFKDDSLTFLHLTPGISRSVNLEQGFYEVVYDGKIKCLIKHQSLIIVKDGLDEYSYTAIKYFKAGNTYVKVKSGEAFIKLFGSESDAVRKFMKTNKIHFRSAGKHEIAEVLRYYDSLAMSNK